MGFLTPWTALIAAAITIPALVSLYFLKLRRRQVEFPSTLLWKKAIHDLQVNAPFQRLRRNLLLLLQLLILAALLIAMARPTMQTTADPGRRIAIVIDHSASMNSTDGAPTRLDQAKEAALRLIDDLGSPDTNDEGAGAAMVVSFAERARVVQQFTGDLARLRAAVRSIEPTDQRGQLEPALQLLEPFALQAAESDSSDALAVKVLSDGRVHTTGESGLALRGAELDYIRLGSEDAAQVDNVGIVSFSARRDFERPERVQVFARLANAGASEVQTNVSLELDGRVRRVRSVSVPAAQVANPDRPDGEPAQTEPGARSVQFDFILPSSAMVTLRHDQDDMLEADNAAHLMLAPARRLRVLLVTESNAFLDRVIRSVGVRQLVQMHPDKYADQDPERLRRGGWDDDRGASSAEQGFDVIVFDGYSPEEVPAVDSLYFKAAPPIEGLALRAPREGEPTAQVLLDWRRDHPLLRYVVLDNVILNEPGRVALPSEGTVLATSQTGPVMATVQRGGVRHIVTSFDVLNTNWPMQVSFPVFVSNVVQVLGLGALADEAGIAFHAGQVASVPGAREGETRVYDGPKRISATVASGEAVLPRFERVGVYRAE
ncbi:MAG: vWA domain-containing protein, partial [Phycisphaeraceae bacterium]